MPDESRRGKVVRRKFKVAVWVSGGVIQGARASDPDVELVVYDEDELEAACEPRLFEEMEDEYEAVEFAIL